MALKPRKAPFDTPTVQARESAVAEDLKHAPGGYWIIRADTIWRSDHPAVLGWPEFFVALGDGPTSPPFVPDSQFVPPSS